VRNSDERRETRAEQRTERRADRAEQAVKHSPSRREERRAAVSKWLDPPLIFASILLILLTIIQLTTPLPGNKGAVVTLAETGIWVFFAGSFAVELAISGDRAAFLRHHWLRALGAVLPFFGFLRILSVVRFGHIAAYVRLFLLSRRTGSPALEILRRRHLGQVALISLFVFGISAALEYLVEAGTRGANIETPGDALWWAAATMSTIGAPQYPVTNGGRVVALLLMFYAVIVFTYFVASLASVLAGHDAEEPPVGEEGPSRITAQEARVVRRVLMKLERASRERHESESRAS
jgi:voltage-gated potassium channel